MSVKDNSVLIVDDDPWMQRVLSKIFAKMEIDRVYFASNGFEGVNLAILKRPDVIFLDLMMPEVNGITTLKMLKSIELTKQIAVIVITANSDFENLGAVIACGASEFVAKPFTYSTIIGKLESVLSKVNVNKIGNKAQESTEASGDFSYDEFDDGTDFFAKFDDIMPNVTETPQASENVDTNSNAEANLFIKKYKNNDFENTDKIKRILQ